MRREFSPTTAQQHPKEVQKMNNSSEKEYMAILEKEVEQQLKLEALYRQGLIIISDQGDSIFFCFFECAAQI